MAKMKKDPKKEYKIKNRQDDKSPIPDFDFVALKTDSTIKIIITVDEEGYIMSYNHPLTSQNEKLKNETNNQPYKNDGIYSLATISLLTYIEKGGSDDDVEIGYWQLTSGGRIMVS